MPFLDKAVVCSLSLRQRAGTDSANCVSDNVVDVPGVRVVQILRCKCGGDSRLPKLQLVEKSSRLRTCSWTRLLICRCCATTGAWSLGAENCGFSAVAVHRQGVDVPAIMQRRSLAVGGATDSVHRLIWWTPSLHRDRMQLGTWLRCVICVSHRCRWCRSRQEFHS